MGNGFDSCLYPKVESDARHLKSNKDSKDKIGVIRG